MATMFPAKYAQLKKMTLKEKLEYHMRHTFKVNDLRRHQKKAIQAVIKNRDCMVLAPTGGGKSLCYQMSALLLPGVTVVISPLIALMKNQVDALVGKQVKAVRFDSSVPIQQKRESMADLRSTSPNIKIMYLSPEDLKTQEKQDLLNKLYCANQLSMFAIDECHCISSWGHEFRPAYLQLSNLKARFSKVPIMALTATATPEVRNDICHLLFGDEASTSSSSSSSSSSFPSHSLMPASTASREKGKLKLIVENFDRPNIVYFVKYKETIKDINANIINFVAKFRNESGIIYVGTRKEAENLAADLKKQSDSKLSCEAYHAGMSMKTRTQVQNEWMEGRIKVIISTVAFGMGIDKLDVRFVIHFNVPKSLDHYYQESGRAGRDGLPSVALLYYSQEDKRRQEYFSKQPDSWGGKKKGSKTLKSNLQREHEERQIRRAQQTFSHVIKYAEHNACRRKSILSYFGQGMDCEGGKRGRCCDVCANSHKVKVNLEKSKSIDHSLRAGRKRPYSTGKSEMVFGMVKEESFFDMDHGYGAQKQRQNQRHNGGYNDEWEDDSFNHYGYGNPTNGGSRRKSILEMVGRKKKRRKE